MRMHNPFGNPYVDHDYRNADIPSFDIVLQWNEEDKPQMVKLSARVVNQLKKGIPINNPLSPSDWTKKLPYMWGEWIWKQKIIKL